MRWSCSWGVANASGSSFLPLFFFSCNFRQIYNIRGGGCKCWCGKIPYLARMRAFLFCPCHVFVMRCAVIRCVHVRRTTVRHQSFHFLWMLCGSGAFSCIGMLPVAWNVSRVGILAALGWRKCPFCGAKGTFRLFLSGDCLGIRIFVLSKYFEVFCVVSCCCSGAFLLRFPVFFAFRSDGRGRDSSMEDGKVRTSLTESAVF